MSDEIREALRRLTGEVVEGTPGIFHGRLPGGSVRGYEYYHLGHRVGLRFSVRIDELTAEQVAAIVAVLRPKS